MGPLKKFWTITAIIPEDLPEDSQPQFSATSHPAILDALADHWRPFLDGTSNESYCALAAEQVAELTSTHQWDWSNFKFPPNAIHKSKDLRFLKIEIISAKKPRWSHGEACA